MTPLSRELQSLIEANKTLDDSIASAKSVEVTYDDAVNEFMACLWIDLGEAGFRRIWREFNQLSEELLRSPEDRYRDAIETVRHTRATAKGERMANVLRNAAIQSEKTMTATESQDIDIKKVLEALRMEEPEEIDRRIAEALPTDSVVWSRNTGFQVKCGDGLWHWNFGGKHFTCNALHHPGLYAVVIRGEAKDTTPRPGDRLTTAQLRDAPDGTVVDMSLIAGGATRLIKNDGFWLDNGRIIGMGGECTLVHWGRA